LADLAKKRRKKGGGNRLQTFREKTKGGELYKLDGKTVSQEPGSILRVLRQRSGRRGIKSFESEGWVCLASAGVALMKVVHKKKKQREEDWLVKRGGGEKGTKKVEHWERRKKRSN